MPRLLYLENADDAATPSDVRGRMEAAGFVVEVFSAYRGHFPADLEGYDAVYIGGSPHGAYEDIDWIHAEHELIRKIADRGIPTLGVCFGSQILASALCGRTEVFRRTSCEVGYVPLAFSGSATDDPLMRGLDGGVRMFVWHNDEVRPTGEGMVILAASENCPNHIWRYRDLPIWGIQGHPEVKPLVARDWLTKNRPILERDGADVDDLIADPGSDPAVDSFLGNFLALARATSGGAAAQAR